MSNHTTYDPNFKRCSKGDECVHPDGPVLPRDAEHYYIQKNGRPSAMCRECARAYRRRYYAENKEKQKAQMRTYYRENKDAVRKLTERWRKKNQNLVNDRAREKYQSDEGVREQKRGYYRENRERYLENNARWAKENPARRREITARNRAKQYGIEHTWTADDLRAIFDRQNGKCYWCGKDVGDDWQTDHRVPLARGGKDDASNLVVSCRECNQSKASKLPHEWNGRLL